MELLARSCAKLLVIVALLLLISSCEKGEEPVGPSLTDWEGNAPNFNEAYRDSIVVLSGKGITFLSKDGTVGRFMGGFTAPPQFVSWMPRKWKLLYAPTYFYSSAGQHLYSMNPDGTGSQPITKSPELILHAMMSPDGQKIAYLSIDSTDFWHNKGWVKVINPDGTGIRVLTSRIIGPSSVTWTPDSREVIYTDGDSAESRINIVSIDGTGHRILRTNSWGTCDYPSLSPDGSELAFCTTFASSIPYRVQILDMSSLQVRSLTTSASEERCPTWSTDGQQIVFCAATGMWRVGRDGRNPVCIALPQASYQSPSWYK